MSEPAAEPQRPSRIVTPTMYEPFHPSFVSEMVDVPEDSPNIYRVIPTANRFFTRLVERISSAEDTVDLQFYTLEADHKVADVLDACTEAAARGVQVRIRADHLVSDPRRLFSTLDRHKQLGAMPNLEIKHQTTKRARAAGAIASVINRDHKKIAAIDTNTNNGSVMIGGINLAARNLRWNDFMIEMQGQIATLIQRDFDDTWNDANTEAKKQPDETEPGTFLLTDSQSALSISEFAQERVAEAQQRVWLETPYLDMASIGQTLIEAKRANPDLDVRVIIPRFNNYPVDRVRARSMLDVLAKAGIHAYSYGVAYRRLNHTKLLLVDDLVMFGSSNFSISSLAGNNAEIEVATQNPFIVTQLEKWYEEDIAQSIQRQ